MNARKALFQKLAKEHYTILCPDMLPIHFSLLTKVIKHTHGLDIVVVSPKGRTAKDEGLKSIHNDACYPALIVLGQFVAELNSGKYDLNKTAVIMSQTGGGCRASNYISLFRKAFAKLFPTVPVLSLNFSGLEKDASLPLTPKFIIQAVTAIQYGDMIMNLSDQCAPYEKEPGQVKAITDEVLAHLSSQIGHPGFMKLKKNLSYILNAYKGIEIPKERKPRIAVVGEIYVKYSPYANNDLASYLVSQGCEVAFPSLSEFVLYCAYNMIEDARRYDINPGVARIVKIVYRYFLGKTRKMNAMLEGTPFFPFEDFEDVVAAAKDIISTGVKMGEGWLIPAEMLCYGRHGVTNIVCAQPFGCLPNHIVGKGMVRPLKKLCPELNVTPLDFDASSTAVNQENRLKLMLSTINKK